AAASLLSTLEKISTKYGKDVNSWRWGATHQALHAHPAFGRLPVLADLFNIVLPSDGGDDTVNRGQVGRGRDGDPLNFTHVHGAGYRAVYDLADLANSRLMIATGQSGHPLSPHYQDLAEAWRDGLTRTLAGSREEIEARKAKRLSLTPL
ncbi:MAG: penicillin acylase family protein, partial [Elsteraceae bacterium]